MTVQIRNFYAFLLDFPVSHYISGWRNISRTHHLLVFIATDEGIIGLGEGTPYATSHLSDYIYALRLLGKLKGCNIEDALSTLRMTENKLFEKRSTVNFGAFLAIESALLDALAKARKSPVAEVLGGAYRTTLPVAGTVFLGHPLRMVKRIRWWLERGVKHVKLKIPCNINKLELYLDTVMRITRLRNEGVTLRVDANECFKELDKAYKALQIMSRYGVDIVEQPMPRDRLREIARLRKAFSPTIKIMLDESLMRPQDLETFATMEAADIVNFHPSKLGCPSITREAILKAKKLGFEVNIGSSLMTEVGLAHYLNLAASLPELDYPLEEVGIKEFYPSYSVLKPQKSVLLTITNGNMKLPSDLGTDINFEDLRLDTLKAFFERVEPSYILRDKVKMLLSNIIRNL
ncbi:MAG: hypothetical protein B7O98_08030 [Zestosphaera tikiterensis]|uniref:Mandelate racemase/muconate lactonizing enzyme C-terminal domain-containing protein n=1 Tax=Zestosphaera tikiterensis TaxID=1973259 RepID=A0A2R7Y3I4_9CREN|nr:MAG: hypothetical protein B7O98_08030 [Zestosphaera tikiterensis]